MPACPPPTIRTSKARGFSMISFREKLTETVPKSLADYGAVVADDLDRVGVGVEDAHPHGGGGEQEPEDAAPEVPRVRRLDPTDLGVRQVCVGGDEPLQEEAQGDAQGEGE